MLLYLCIFTRNNLRHGTARAWKSHFHPQSQNYVLGPRHLENILSHTISIQISATFPCQGPSFLPFAICMQLQNNSVNFHARIQRGQEGGGSPYILTTDNALIEPYVGNKLDLYQILM